MTSSSSPLRGKRVLVVEDEYMIADDLACELRGAGAEVVGPAASLPQAMRLMGSRGRWTLRYSTSTCGKHWLSR